MNRRTFLCGLTLGMLAGPLAGQAQRAGKVYRIGALIPGVPPANPDTKGPFRQGMHDLGYVEGRDFVVEFRWAEGHLERLPELARDLVRANVDVILTFGTPATIAAQQATKTIPIVFASSGQVVEKGMVQSLAHPGGNLTGLQLQVSTSKGLQLLKDTVPTVTRVALLYDPAIFPGKSLGAYLKESHRGARAQSIELQPVVVNDPNGVAAAFGEFAPGTNGLLIERASVLLMMAGEICRLALQRKLPALGLGREFADAGCLMSYGENLPDMSRRAAYFVDKILRGARPSDLPVEQPSKFELVINLKSAKSLGLTIPPTLLLRADQVIE